MNKKELAMLEKAFDAELVGAFTGTGLTLMQTRSKVAEKLVEDGLLERSVQCPKRAPNIRLEGYKLTHAGRYLYCSTCDA